MGGGGALSTSESDLGQDPHPIPPPHHRPPQISVSYTCETDLSFGPLGLMMIPYRHVFNGITTFEPDNVDITLVEHIETHVTMVKSR